MTRAHRVKTVCRGCGTMTYEYRDRLYVPLEGTVLTGRLNGDDPFIEQFALLPHICEDAAVEE